MAGALLLLCLSLPPAAIRADNLDEYLAIVQAGAPELAIGLMERAQPDPQQDLLGWMSWEQELAGVLLASRQWETLLVRLEQLPEEVPPRFELWAKTRRALANVRLGRGESARRLLREMLWDSSLEVDEAVFAYWRRLVIQSYLGDERLDDSRDALQRYRQDYGDDPALRSLEAEVLLRSRRFRQAAAVLATDASGAMSTLLLYARLESGALSPLQARATVTARLAGEGLDAGEQARLWVVAAKAAEGAGDLPERVVALEHALALQPMRGGPSALLTAVPDDLWRGYLLLGERVGNEARLLIGDDPSWHRRAAALAKEDPVIARALYAVLAQRSRSPAARARAAGELVAQLDEAYPKGSRIVQALFLDSDRYRSVSAVPLPVRYRLVDEALVAGDIGLATRLMQDLETPPAGSDPVAWQLRRARVLVLGGRYEDGSAAVSELLAGLEGGDRELVDRILQVIFDLQTVSEHEAAQRHLEVLRERAADPQQQREILYWMADSASALGDHERAAFLYLRSATLYDPRGMDPWGQTARYQAAQTLAEGGMVRDARRLYEQLLDVTEDPARRAVLRHGMQQLWLAE